MTITASTADQLEALGLAIFDPHTELGGGTHATGLQAQDDATDAQYLALIAEPMLTIDGRVMATGFKYGLNITNALQGRPKHWYLELRELAAPSLWPAACKTQLSPAPGGGVMPGPNSFGWSIGLAAQACICHTWAFIIRQWLAGNYPLGVNQPTP